MAKSSSRFICQMVALSLTAPVALSLFYSEAQSQSGGNRPNQNDSVRSRDQVDCETVANSVKKIVVEHLGADAANVKEDSKFIEDLGADSLDTVELVMAFEEEFGIEIPDDAAEKVQTVGEAIIFIKGQVRSKDSPSGSCLQGR